MKLPMVEVMQSKFLPSLRSACSSRRAPSVALPLLVTLGALAAAPAVAQDWEGVYAGGDLGLALEGGDSPTRSLHLGYDMDMGVSVLGTELEYVDTDIGAPGGPIEDIVRVKLRAGIAQRDTFVYGVLGAAVASGNFGTETGAVAGIGIEQRLSDHVSLGGEVLYHDFPDFNGGAGLGVNTVSVRASYRF